MMSGNAQGQGGMSGGRGQHGGGMTVSAIHSPHAGGGGGGGHYSSSKGTSANKNARASPSVSSAANSTGGHRGVGPGSMDEGSYKMQHGLPQMYSHMDFGEKLRAESSKLP